MINSTIIKNKKKTLWNSPNKISDTNNIYRPYFSIIAKSISVLLKIIHSSQCKSMSVSWRLINLWSLLMIFNCSYWLPLVCQNKGSKSRIKYKSEIYWCRFLRKIHSFINKCSLNNSYKPWIKLVKYALLKWNNNNTIKINKLRQKCLIKWSKCSNFLRFLTLKNLGKKWPNWILTFHWNLISIYKKKKCQWIINSSMKLSKIKRLNSLRDHQFQEGKIL